MKSFRALCVSMQAVFLTLLLNPSLVKAESAVQTQADTQSQTPTQDQNAESTAKVLRISRPISALESSPTPVQVSTTESLSSSRLSRNRNQPSSSPSASESNSTEARFSTVADGISVRWWRKLKNPTFCPFVICGGSCADISGVPKIGTYSKEELLSEETPCSLEQLTLAGGNSCCMSKNVANSADVSSSSGSCCSESPDAVKSSLSNSSDCSHSAANSAEEKKENTADSCCK